MDLSRTHLLLWRHAEAEEGYPDHLRALTPDGVRQAQRMARWLNEYLPAKAVLLSSPALRTQQTIGAFSCAFETHPLLAVDSTPGGVLRCCGWDNPPPRQPVTLIVGHQPTLGQVAALLLTGESAPWSVRKGALWWLTQREKDGQTQTILRAVIDPEFL